MTETTNDRPRITLGGPAPDFEANSTHGMIKLSNYTKAGKWVVMFSHPADFTPVCTTEFVGFAKLAGEFEKRNTQLIGVSVDSVYSHIAWMRNIEDNFGVKVPFPVVADLDQNVAQLYGMVHKPMNATMTVRCVFIIDPKQNVRAMVYYPMQVGRNMDEFVRVIDALQTVDANACATPANWHKGDEVIVPAPATSAAAAERVGDKALNVKQWYLSTKKVQ
ncbi:MAG: peroxiredoxin [Planctomycetes bacterium]|nr:peroxiredoxin [Planctomycetota bacterium]